MKKQIILLVSLLIVSATNAQVLIYHADSLGNVQMQKAQGNIDNDNLPDSVFFDSQQQSLVFLLSTLDYHSMTINVGNMLETHGRTMINVLEGGVEFTHSTMRNWSSTHWMYEEETGKFRMSHLYEEYHGPTENSTKEYDCLTNEFIGNWMYYDHKADSLVTLPTVNLHLYNPTVYLNDTVIDYYIPGDEFLESYKNAHVPSATYTGRFISFTYEGGEYYNLSMKTPDGLGFNNLIGYNYEQLYRGDSISVTEGTVFYSEPGEGEHYYARVMISDIQLLQPGEIRRFHESNRKEIEYHPDTEFYMEDAWDDRILDGVVDFFVKTDCKSLKKSLKQPGRMDVYITDYKQEDQQTHLDVLFLTEVRNTYKGKTDIVCRFLMKMDMFSPEEIEYNILAK